MSIPSSQLDVVDGTNLMILCISNMDFSIPPLTATDPPPTLGESILESLYSDPNQGDVIFMFDRPTEPLSTDEFPVYSLSGPDTVLERLESINMSDDGEKTSDPTSASSFHQVESLGQVGRFAQFQVLKAHKSILSQWPYFKAMFEGGFAESGPGEQQIRIKDTKVKTFELLLRFMCTGRLSTDLLPRIVYSDTLENREDVSMEDLFLAADRYSVKELQEPMLKSLLANLDVANVVPFLFRSAYMIPELREPVVKFVAKSCGSAIPKNNIRCSFKDHPDVVDILVDLLEAYDELHP
ncbi:hypothetical protein BGZ82_010197 [Podila clonocystis]|nr:hypothetical protein BGZ82_010197 [Podila clonocystis]